MKSFGGSPQVFLIALTFLFCMGCHREQPHHTTQHQGTEDYDSSFMLNLGDHNLESERLLNPCIQKAPHPELRELCQARKRDNQRETESLAQWLSAWYNSEPPHSDDTLPLWVAGLNGSQFEIEALKALMSDEGEAIEFIRNCPDKAKREELKQLCTSSLQKRSEFRKVVSERLCTWYQVCR